MREYRPGQHRPNDRSEQDGQCCVAHHALHVLSADAPDHHLRHGRQHARDEPLKKPCADQRRHAVRRAAKHRRKRERGEAEQIKTLRTHAVHEPAVERQHQRHCQQIAAHDPLRGRNGCAERMADARQRNVHERRIHLRHERANRNDQRDFPDARIDA
jgi:hypothetical protein